MPSRSEQLAGARLYLVCDDPGEALLAAVLAAGVDIVQLRMKRADDARILAAAHRVGAACAAHGALFILNDRADLVTTAGADGVHVGQDDLSVAEARALVGEQRLVGLSTHSPHQIDAAIASGPDYIGVGPVHATPTKPGRPAVGTELVTYAAGHCPIPFFAIGGIDPSNVGAVVRAGAERVAVVRALSEAEDPAGAARALRSAIETGREAVGGRA